MDINIVTRVVLGGICYGAWLLILRASNISSSRVLFAAGIGCLFVGSFGAGNCGKEKLWVFLLAFLAGTVGAIGTKSIEPLISNKNLSLLWIPSLTAIQLVTTALGAIIFFGDALTMKKFCGMKIVIIGAFLLV